MKASDTYHSNFFPFLRASLSFLRSKISASAKTVGQNNKKLLFQIQDGTKQEIQTNLEIAAVLPSQ